MTILNRMSNGPRPIGPPEHFSWQLPVDRGMCNVRIYLYFLVSLARVLGMEIEDGNGKRITDHSELEAYRVADQKRVTISFTLTDRA
jgi:hypothetical protein